ncbi:STE3-domain-containing protein [Peniophora sp. CONT]|nr:STE3-domain-containing protein [Peniophora sp. CONT]
MGAVDPTYPLYPIAAIISAVLLLSVLLSSFVRQGWNLGVAFLCFWLFLENLTGAVSAIIWSDNDDTKLYVYCDIVTHLQFITYVVKPMSTLLIMRRLYVIAGLPSVTLVGEEARRLDRVVEWTLGFIIPVLVAGPIYYVVQDARFEVLEGTGCASTTDVSIPTLLLIYPWLTIPPLASAILYYPRVARKLYLQGRESNHFLRSNDPISRTMYTRVLAIASIELILSLSLNITNLALNIVAVISTSPVEFYSGWDYVHTDWAPIAFAWQDMTPYDRATTYYSYWTSIMLGFVIFGLFGITAGARASYRRAICTATGWVERKPTWRGRAGATRAMFSSIRFNRRAPPQEGSLASCELGFLPSVIDIAPPPPDTDAESQTPLEDVVSELDEYKGSSQESDEADQTRAVRAGRRDDRHWRSLA